MVDKIQNLDRLLYCKSFWGNLKVLYDFLTLKIKFCKRIFIKFDLTFMDPKIRATIQCFSVCPTKLDIVPSRIEYIL